MKHHLDWNGNHDADAISSCSEARRKYVKLGREIKGVTDAWARRNLEHTHSKLGIFLTEVLGDNWTEWVTAQRALIDAHEFAIEEQDQRLREPITLVTNSDGSPSCPEPFWFGRRLQHADCPACSETFKRRIFGPNPRSTYELHWWTMHAWAYGR